MARFIVEAETKPNTWVNVYSGDDEASAIRTANFWDERVNVKFQDVKKEQFIERARIASLSFQEQLDEVYKQTVKKIEVQSDEAIQRLYQL